MADIKKIVFIGRLEKDTGVLDFLKWLDGQRNELYGVSFVGDGSLRKDCERYGKVFGFTDPKPFMQKADICIPGGYLSYIEAKEYGCKIMVFPDNPLKKDYWSEIQEVREFPTWDRVADEYLNLYNGSK